MDSPLPVEDLGPDSADYVFDFGAECELAEERRAPLLSVFAGDDDSPLGVVLDLDRALAGLDCFGPLDDEPDTERSPELVEVSS